MMIDDTAVNSSIQLTDIDIGQQKLTEHDLDQQSMFVFQ